MIGPVSRPSLESSERERQLDTAIADYIQAVEAGRAPDRRAFLDKYPDFADDLRSFFDNEDRVRKLAGTMPVPAGDRDRRRAVGAIPRQESDAELGVGGEFGDFELIEQIAVGGMGIVFKARQKRLNRVVALKTIRPSALRPGHDAVQRFRIEAEAVARLDHPNIVPIFEMGEYRGYPFLSLKLIEGNDLDRHISRLRRDPTAIAELMVQVAGAVHYAHLRGILHRDLKPSNILVDRRGRPHVTDFGLAKCVEVDSGLTQSGLIIGTPSYMAPEQVSGLRGEVTTAADIYGLGAVLYTLLSGRPPVPGRFDLRDAPAGPGAGTGAPRRDRPRGGSRPGGDLPEVPRERPGASLRLRRGGGRGPGTLARRRADRGPTGREGGAGLAVVSSQSGGRPALGGRRGVVPGRPGHRGGRVRAPARTGRGGVLIRPEGARAPGCWPTPAPRIFASAWCG